MKDESLSSEWGHVEEATENASATPSEQGQSAMDLDEEDESHLPPGVRRQNRINNSSDSSSSEDEAEQAKKSKEVTSSDSDSDKSDHKPVKHESSSSSKHLSKHESKRLSKDKDVSGKGRHSRSGSRSRSRSASPRRRRKSSDRSRHSRSRSRDRRHKKERRRRSHRSKSRDRRRSKDRHRHKRERRRSRSRSRDKRDRHRDRRSRRSRSRSRRSRSRSRSGDRRRDRDRSHSRSPSPVGKVIKFGDKVIKPGASFGRPSNFSKPLTFKEKMRQQFIKAMEDGTNATDPLTTKDGVALCTQSAGIHQQPPQPKKPPVPLMANLVTSTASLASMTVTASEAAMQSMLALQKEATEKTGVEIPKYYNPAAINPMKYAEQVQKRKLLWSKSKEKDVKSQWHATSLSGDHDDKSKEKFRKLMGIREESPVEEETDISTGDVEDKQRQLFDQLHKEYQFARMATHTHRGIGLGFGSSAFPEPPSS